MLATPPLSYLRALGLMRAVRLAITNSGGVQKEMTALGVPCLTVRDDTEWPSTIDQRTNTLLIRSNAERSSPDLPFLSLKYVRRKNTSPSAGITRVNDESGMPCQFCVVHAIVVGHD
jgi:UDP-N-acetylglucosamine 2-epimerase